MRYALQTVAIYVVLAYEWLMSYIGWRSVDRQERIRRKTRKARRQVDAVFNDARKQMDAVSSNRSDAYIPDLGSWREW